MIDVIKKSLEIGLGAVTVTKEKLQEITDELVLKGDLTKKEGNTIFKEFVDAAENSQKKIRSIVDEQVHNVIKEAGIATKADIKALEGRLDLLKSMIDKSKDSKEAK